MPDCDDVKLEDCECNCDGRLETLNLSTNNLGDVDSQILAAGISNVLRVNLGIREYQDSDFFPDQLQNIIERCIGPQRFQM